MDVKCDFILFKQEHRLQVLKDKYLDPKRKQVNNWGYYITRKCVIAGHLELLQHIGQETQDMVRIDDQKRSFYFSAEIFWKTIKEIGG